MTKRKRLLLGIYAGLMLFFADILVSLYLRYRVYNIAAPKLSHILLANIVNFVFVVAVVYYLLPKTKGDNHGEDKQDSDSNV